MVWGTSGVLAGLGKEVATVGKYRRMQSRGRAVEQVGALMAPGAEPVRLRTFGCADACRHYNGKTCVHPERDRTTEGGRWRVPMKANCFGHEYPREDGPAEGGDGNGDGREVKGCRGECLHCELGLEPVMSLAELDGTE